MKNLLDYSLLELQELLTGIGEKPFRAKQVMKWLMQGKTFDEMTDLSIALRQKLKMMFREGYANTLKVLKSEDGTQKYLFGFEDGCSVESVFMQKNYGNTICLSTQVGCRMGCAFCASGANGLVRNLSAGEILAQIIAVNAAQGEGRNITNIVLMGMGEPLDNYDNVVKFLRLVNDKNGLGIGMRNISLSTCGLVERMLEFVQEDLPVTLSVSLHAASDEKRRQIMPTANRYPITEIIKAANNYFLKSGRRIIIEYAVIEDLNDGAEDAALLKNLLSGLNCHVNLIPLNSNIGVTLKAPATRKVYAFCDKLNKAGLSATVRKSMGSDISGACGQLKQQYTSGGGKGNCL